MKSSQMGRQAARSSANGSSTALAANQLLTGSELDLLDLSLDLLLSKAALLSKSEIAFLAVVFPHDGLPLPHLSNLHKASIYCIRYQAGRSGSTEVEKRLV